MREHSAPPWASQRPGLSGTTCSLQPEDGFRGSTPNPHGSASGRHCKVTAGGDGVCVLWGDAYSSGIFLEERELGGPPAVGHIHTRLLLSAHGDPCGSVLWPREGQGRKRAGVEAQVCSSPPVSLAARDQKTADLSRLGLPRSMGRPRLCSLQGHGVLLELVQRLCPER